MLTLCIGMLLLSVDPESGPAVGKAAPKLEVRVVRESAGEPEDVAKPRKEKPTLYVFIPKAKWDRAMARFVRAVDEGLENVHEGRLIFVWIAKDEHEASADYLQRVQKSLNLQRTQWTVFKGEPADVTDWELNPDVLLTAVVVREGKVLKSLGYRAINETDAPGVLKLLK